MIVCPSCATTYEITARQCPACGFAPEVHEGFECWAPELAFAGDGFNPDCFAALAANEEGHFWFVARNRLIMWALRRYFPQLTSYLEVGCGTGYVLRAVADNFPAALLCGSEIFVSGLKFAASRVPGARLMQMDARRMPFREQFDVVAAFDVLEHITEDDKALQGLFAAVKPGGGVLLTVPQHEWLWSSTDDSACHKRRYTRGTLHALLQDAGLDIIRNTSFVSLLLPAMAASRLRDKGRKTEKNDHSDEFNLPPRLNTLFDQILNAETRMIQCGLNFPLGGSRLVVARKPDVIT